MIVIYPMLTSASVSPNVLPGIVKAVEKYVLIYNTDAVLRAAGGGKAGKIISTGVQIAGALMAGEDKSDKPGENLSEDVSTTKTTKTKDKDTGEERGKTVQIRSGSSVRPSLDLPRSEAVSLEPTWLQVTTQKKGLQLLGVKVIPFQVKSGQSMAQLIMQDKELKSLEYLTTKYGRKISRVFNRIMKKLPGMGDKTITGDPTKDVIYAESKHGKNMFVCLSQLDLENDDVFSSPAGVQRLHKLGWASFAIVDDVNKRVTFCMKEFNGICSVVPFGFMFASLGKDHAKVYEDMEDVKKTSGPFFNMRTNRKRAFAEHKSAAAKYLELIQK